VPDDKRRKGWIAATWGWSSAILLAVAVPVGVALITIESAQRGREASRLAADAPPVTSAKAAFERIGFNVRRLQQTPAAVPRVLLPSLPRELPHITNTGERKALFLTSMLPLVLQVNEIIQAERERLLALRQMVEAGHPLSADDHQWLKTLREKYRVEELDLDRLLRRVNVIPPSLALAQAAIESGWGTSRFAQQGNAIFGQWTWGDHGMIPRERREGSRHRIKTFDHPIESVAAYARNLNTHPAYAPLRAIREDLARSGRTIPGPSLIPGLRAYSERGDAYTRDLDAIIRGNRLTRFDGAYLEYSALAPEIDSPRQGTVAMR